MTVYVEVFYLTVAYSYIFYDEYETILFKFMHINLGLVIAHGKWTCKRGNKVKREAEGFKEVLETL